MNLFVTDTDPVLCARALDDKRVGKMLMEANQMLSLAVKTFWEDDSYVFYETNTELTRGWSHVNHPVTIWVRSSRDNFAWTIQHAKALADEFEVRYGKRHASESRIRFMSSHVDTIPEGSITPFQNSARNAGIGVDFSHLPVCEAYREYLNNRWISDIRYPSWTNRGAPSWYRS